MIADGLEEEDWIEDKIGKYKNWDHLVGKKIVNKKTRFGLDSKP